MADDNDDKSIRLEDLAQAKEVPSVETARLSELRRIHSPQEKMTSQIPYDLAKGYCMVPISLREDGPAERTITVVMANPRNDEAVDYLKNTVVGDRSLAERLGLIKYNIRIFIAPEDQVKSAIERLYELEAADERISKEVLPMLMEMDELYEAGGI